MTGLSDSAQTEALRDRLRDKGFKFKGNYPNKIEIKEARQKHEKEHDLDGMDTSAILPASHKRGYAHCSLLMSIEAYLCHIHLNSRREAPCKDEKSKPQILKTKTNTEDSEEEFTL